MITAFIGTVGSGKTLSAVYEVLQYAKQNYAVYSNIKLNFPHTLLTKRVFDDLIHDKSGLLNNSIILIDEAHIWLDSRSGMQKKNKAITYFILQTRKRNVRMFITTQHLHQVDKRLRDTIDILVFCRNMSNQTSTVENDQEKKVYIQNEFLFQWADQPPRKRLLYANPIFPLYDTSEMVDINDADEDEEEEPRSKKKSHHKTKDPTETNDNTEQLSFDDFTDEEVMEIARQKIEREEVVKDLKKELKRITK